MQIDWRIKSLAFRALHVMPESILYFLQKHVTKRQFDGSHEISPHWVYHEEALKRFGSKEVIEFGAGKSLAQNLYLSRLGIKQTVVDLNRMMSFNVVNASIRALNDMGILDKAPTIHLEKDLQRHFGITYKAPVDIGHSDFADNSFDANISSSTLEHIPTPAIPGIFSELKRIIRPGGIISARTDYSDHYAHTDRKISEVSHLRFSDARWWLHNPPNHYQNRLRHGHFRKMAEEAGLELVDDDPRTPMPEWPHPVRQDLLAGDGFDLYNRGSFIWRVR
jgi:SAM-dependent methyltransferase